MRLYWSLIICLPALAAAGAVQPTVPFVKLTAAVTQPTSQPTDRIKSLLNDLASEDPEIRRKARSRLLAVSRDDLLTIRRLVAAGAARQPAAKQALYEIVCHVYLATEPYEASADESFFGIFKYRPVAIGDRTGLVFESRLIGFPAYASLEDGDIILAVQEVPGIDFTSNNPLAAVRQNFKPGDTIHLQVLRDDRVLAVPLTLAPSPTWSGQGTEERVIRELQATEFWRREFEPLWDSKAQ